MDEFVNLDNVSSKTDTWDVFNPHPETGLSVIGRKSTSFDNIITYKPEGKAITGIIIAVQYVPDFVDINSHIKVSVRAAGTDEWTDLALSISQPQDIPNATNNVFKSAQITPSASLPSNIVEVKIQLLNDVLWTLFLDRVTMGLANLDIPDETTPEEPTDPTPVKEYNFVDELENFDKISDLSDNWESFNPHPESGLSVIGKTNGKRGYASYMQKGKTIADFEISLQLAPAFFNQDAHLLVQVRQKGSEDWQTLKVKCSLPVSAGGVFYTTLVTPDETLPENIEELKITLYNDVAWTLMLDAVKINYTGQAEPSDTTTEPSNTSTTSKPVTTSPSETNPKTGNSVAILPILLMVIGASLVLTMWRKNLKITTR